MSAIRSNCLAALFVLIVPVLTTLHAAETIHRTRRTDSDSARLTLPTTIYAVPGLETSLYFANAILAAPTAGVFVCRHLRRRRNGREAVEAQRDGAADGRVSADAQSKRWFGPTRGAGQDPSARGSARMPDASETSRLLIVGDSLTHASQYPNELAPCSRSRAIPSGRCSARTSQPPLRRTSPMRATEAGPGGPLTRVSIRRARWRLGPIAARSCSPPVSRLPRSISDATLPSACGGRAARTMSRSCWASTIASG